MTSIHTKLFFLIAINSCTPIQTKSKKFKNLPKEQIATLAVNQISTNTSTQTLQEQIEHTTERALTSNIETQTEDFIDDTPTAPLGMNLRQERNENAQKLSKIQELLKAVAELEKTYGKFLTPAAKKILNDLKVELNSSLTGLQKLISEIDEHLKKLETIFTKLPNDAKRLFVSL